MRDLYEVLEVSKTATDDEIKKSYRRLARKYHPDLNPGNKQAEERFKEVSIANDVLSHADKRKLYDEFGLESIRPGFDEQRVRILRSGFGGGAGFGTGGTRTSTQSNFDVNDIFEQIFRAGSPFGTRRPPRPQPSVEEPRGQNLEQTISIDLEDVLHGREMQYRMSRPDGEVVNLKVKIPAGVSTGDRIRLAGQGMPGMTPRLHGDLILRVEIAPHPIFRVQERDVSIDLPVTLPELVLGAQVEVPTLEGKLRVRVPVGSQAGKKLRLTGKGLRDRKSETRGDFYVVLQLVLPEPADPKGQAKLQELARAMAPLYGDVRRDILSQSKVS